MIRAVLLSLAVASLALAAEPDKLDSEGAALAKQYSNVTVTRDGATTAATIDLGSADWRQPRVDVPFMGPFIRLILAANELPDRNLQLLVLVRGRVGEEHQAHAARCGNALRSARGWSEKNARRPAQVTVEVRCLER